MGASKYEFNALQFDIDVANNRRKYKEKKELARRKIVSMLEEEPPNMEENFSMLLEIMRELKVKYNL